ncbi:MAG: ABC transporter ATP-binding protein [Syntrophales bacterium]|jgi:iron complex transport system ATP-binding protein|nr:ABC transporter ATP-binding protein [Syntrophales bacterium]MCK9527481.1 ABC transporter ATP-binding protein [Syntrophales bacterium]MDX9922537.1 ABC transporter ATP-binding protein [Syntrophales bacterium]
MKALFLEGIWFHYHDGPWVLEDLSCNFSTEDFWGVIGPNGSGKTTLIRIISGLAVPQRGRVSLDGLNMQDMRRADIARRIAVVPQDSSPVFPFSVEEVVLMGRAPHLGRFQFESDSDLAIARNAMKRTGLLSFARRSMTELSGGERQRVLIARALAQQPRMLLLDEPTAFLDIKYQKETFDLLTELNREQGLGIIAVTHDLNLASLYCERLLLLSGGTIHSLGSPEEVITEERVTDVYETDVRVERDAKSGRPRVMIR